MNNERDPRLIAVRLKLDALLLSYTHQIKSINRIQFCMKRTHIFLIYIWGLLLVLLLTLLSYFFAANRHTYESNMTYEMTMNVLQNFPEVTSHDGNSVVQSGVTCSQVLLVSPLLLSLGIFKKTFFSTM